MGRDPVPDRRRRSPAAVVPAHLRRSIHILEWVGQERGGAAIRFGGQWLGTWKGLLTRWSVEGAILRLDLTDGCRPWRGEVLSARMRAGGVDLRCRDGRGTAVGLAIEWEEKGPDADGEFEVQVREWLRRRYPGASVRRITRRAELSRSLSGRFVRVLLRERRGTRFVVAAPPACQAEPGDALTQALLWVGSAGPPRPSRVTLIAPPRMARVLANRSNLVDPNAARVEVLQYDPENGSGEGLSPTGPPPPPVENRDFRWPLLGPFRWSRQLGRVLDLAPYLIRRHPCFSDSDSLRLLGLEFARAVGEDRERVLFGVGSEKAELTEENFGQLEALVDEILYYRRADSPDTGHPHYRAQAERWMESLVLDHVERLLPELQPGGVHPQVPVYLGEEAGRADMIAVDREGTIVVLELKASADPGLPLQALDYRQRVHMHNLRGDFARRGYFSGLPPSRREPRVYLVAPVFAFHDSTERLLSYFRAGIEVWKIAVNEDWRSEMRILSRQMVCSGGQESPAGYTAGEPGL